MAHLEQRKAARTQAEALLTSACRVLSSSRDSVAALVSVLPLDQRDVETVDWARRAAALAEAHHLHVDVSLTKTHMRVRFSRGPG